MLFHAAALSRSIVNESFFGVNINGSLLANMEIPCLKLLRIAWITAD
jgi:hypothetical protein